MATGPAANTCAARTAELRARLTEMEARYADAEKRIRIMQDPTASAAYAVESQASAAQASSAQASAAQASAAQASAAQASAAQANAAQAIKILKPHPRENLDENYKLMKNAMITQSEMFKTLKGLRAAYKQAKKDLLKEAKKSNKRGKTFKQHERLLKTIKDKTISV